MPLGMANEFMDNYSDSGEGDHLCRHVCLFLAAGMGRRRDVRAAGGEYTV